MAIEKVIQKLGNSPMVTPPGESTLKKDFVANAGRKTGKSVQNVAKLRVRKLSDRSARFIKILLYGHTGTGKTFALIGLLLHGLKILVLSTDIGGDGLITVETELKRIGRLDLLDNLYHIHLPTYDDVVNFLKEPETYFEDIYDVEIDVVSWDGFTGFQQVALADYVGEMNPIRGEAGKAVSDGRESGLQFEQTDWGMIRNGTVRNIDRLLNMHNRKTGKVWHKVVTCLEGGKAVKNSLSGEEQVGPLLQGSGRDLIGPAFDVICRTRVVKVLGEKDEDGKTKAEFKYYTVGNQRMLAKSRGIDLESVEDADMFKLWAKITTQLSINKDAIDESKKEAKIVREPEVAA